MENIDLKQKLPGSRNAFRLLYRKTIDHRDMFWAGQAKRLIWQKEFVTVVQEDLSKAEASWFSEGKLNPTENALHRIIDQGMGQRPALTYYQGTGIARELTFSQLKDEVLTLSAALHQDGLREGDCIALNLPNSPEFVVCALAAAYIGVTYLPIGCHLPAAIVAEDVRECRAKLLIMAQGNDSPEKIQSRLESLTILTVGEKREGFQTLDEYTQDADPNGAAPAYPGADHPLFAIYENRLAGQPVGAVFAAGGFLVQAHTSFDLIFNKALAQNEPEQIFNTLDPCKSACQAYGLWGPLTNGIGIVITDDNARIDTLDTLLEDQGNPAMLCRPGLLSEIRNNLDEQNLATANTFSVIACCGGPLPPRLVNFAAGVLISAPEHLVNMWIQNKSGTALINTYPSPELNRPGSLGFGTPGVAPFILDEYGQACKTNVSGNLVFKGSWPAMGRPTYGTRTHFKKTCFSRFKGRFLTYDGVRCDKDGFHWFMGRLDDVIKVKGQTLGTSQIESMIASHTAIEEAVIVSATEDALTAFVVTRGQVANEEGFIKELNAYIAEKVGRFAVPEKIIIAGELPRTASGKLVRRLLRRIASGDAGDNEDTSHLVNATSVKALIEKHKE